MMSTPLEKYPIEVQDKLKAILEELELYYPEKKIFAFDVLCNGVRFNLQLLSWELNCDYTQILSNFGYQEISLDEASLLRTQIVYRRRREPEFLRRRISIVCYNLSTHYPSKIIRTSIKRNYKNLYNLILALSVWLGYSSIHEFLKAYGFSYMVGVKRTISSNSSSKKESKKTTIATKHTVTFKKASLVNVVGIDEFMEHTHFLKRKKWDSQIVPEVNMTYLKNTGSLLIALKYRCSMRYYGTLPTPALEEILIAFRDGVKEYTIIQEKLDELLVKQTTSKRTQSLKNEIEWLIHLKDNINQYLPQFTTEFRLKNNGQKECIESIIFDEGKVSKNPIATKYAVVDLETNGLKGGDDDLLSISIYDPSTGRTYNRFLPLELQPTVVTTYINGIDDADLENEPPLSQKEFDDLITEFDLRNKTLLYYSGGNFEYKFLNHYCKRHKIIGLDALSFLNIKKNIIADYFVGYMSKDNLCNLLGIDGVTGVHSGSNDCYLEWQLFEKLLEKNYLEL